VWSRRQDNKVETSRLWGRSLLQPRCGSAWTNPRPFKVMPLGPVLVGARVVGHMKREVLLPGSPFGERWVDLVLDHHDAGEEVQPDEGDGSFVKVAYDARLDVEMETSNSTRHASTVVLVSVSSTRGLCGLPAPQPLLSVQIIGSSLPRTVCPCNALVP
jgi:hypothetical protein